MPEMHGTPIKSKSLRVVPVHEYLSTLQAISKAARGLLLSAGVQKPLHLTVVAPAYKTNLHGIS